MDLFSSDTSLKSTGITLLISLVAFYIGRFYAKLYNYPPGPIPLPIIGNVLMFRNFTKHWNLELIKLTKMYGPVFTLWIGPLPFVFICDLDNCREAFNKIEFTGRPNTLFGDLYNNEGHNDIIFNDYGHSWESLRRVSHTAIRKYAKSDDLSKVVDQGVREAIDLIMDKQGLNKPFAPKLYIYNMFANITGTAVYSQKFDVEQDEFKKFKYCTTDFQTDLGNWLFLYEFVPIIRWFMRNPLIKYAKYKDEMMKYTMDIYASHNSTYNKGVKRDFCDTLIKAKHEAVEQDKLTAPYYTDDNLAASMNDLFMAGVETTHTAFQWMLLFMAYYPEYQQKLRDEIKHVIGNKVPTVDDKPRLNYVMACVSEILRLRNPTPIGVFHKALVDCKLGKYVIPANTRVVLHQYCILTDKAHWDNPDKFIPERWFDNEGKFLTNKPAAYIPFSYGRRICPGETLAMNDLFLTLIRFIQLTNDYKIEFYGDRDSMDSALEADPINLWLQFPKQFQIILKSK